MQTANDAPDRDVKVVTLEGSNDAEATAWDAGNWELIVQLDDIPAIADRFTTRRLVLRIKKVSYTTAGRWSILRAQALAVCKSLRLAFWEVFTPGRLM